MRFQRELTELLLESKLLIYYSFQIEEHLFISRHLGILVSMILFVAFVGNSSSCEINIHEAKSKDVDYS